MRGKLSAVLWRRQRNPEITPEAIDATVRHNVRLAMHLNPAERDRLHELTAELLASKSWEGANGLTLTDDMRVTVAANAAIPILAHDTWPYRQVKAIIIRPTTTHSSARRAGPAAGTYTDDTIGLVGEASPNHGPLALSWDTVVYESRHPHRGGNVVIHEFAHKIDMNDGYADGVPPLRGVALDEWRNVLADEYEHREPRESDTVLRPYAWASAAEFFAVSSEVFFCQPVELLEAKPVLYGALRELYGQDPAARVPRTEA
ncbi:MAG: M90 family metallopeptidase [Actinomycetota bacterium]|nr:M90 family metallopeptidase [Actinomycetota bacterium]